MRVAVLKERRADEARVAATPETAKKLIALGCTVAVESGAGLPAGFPDAEYGAAGAQVSPDAASALAGAGIVLKVRAPLAAGEGEVERTERRRSVLLRRQASRMSSRGVAPWAGS